MPKILVKAKPGQKCPREDNPRTYITEDPKGTPVDDSSHYRRLIADGSLDLVPGKSKGGES